VVTGNSLFTGHEGSRDLLLKFWYPIYILAMAEARNFKFGTQTDNEGYRYYRKM